MLPYFLLAAGIQTLWGLTPSASKIVLHYLPVEGYSALRYTLSGTLFLIHTLVQRRRLSVRLTQLPHLVFLGILTYGINSLGTLYGLKIGGALNFALASSLNAVTTAGIAILVLKERTRLSVFTAMGLSFVGGLLLFLGKYDVSGFRVAALSLLLIWMAYGFEALGFVFSKKFKERLPLSEYIAVLQLSAAAFLWVLSLSTGNVPHLRGLAPKAWASLAFVSLISCYVCYFVWYWLLHRIEGHQLAFFDCFHTVAAAVFASYFFGEPFNVKMGIGGGVLFLALAVVSAPARKLKQSLVRAERGIVFRKRGTYENLSSSNPSCPSDVLSLSLRLSAHENDDGPPF